MASMLKSILRSPSFGRATDGAANGVLSVLESHCTGQDSSGIEQLIKQLSAMEIEEVQLKEMLVLFRENLHYMDVRCEALVSTLLRLNWCNMNAVTIREYSAFLLSLVSAHPSYLKAVLLMLINNFRPPDKDIGNTELRADGHSQAEATRYICSHAVLQGICQLVPMAPSLLVPLISKSFPYMRHNLHIQEHYVSNLLELIRYIPSQRPAILEVIIDRLTKLDVYSPKHEIMEAEELKQENESHTVFQMDVEGDEQLLSAKPLESQTMAHELANTLDTLMVLMMNFIHKTCFPKQNNGDLDWEASKNLFQELWAVFEKLVLPTHDCSHVQFLLFYLCSLKMNISEAFLDNLWKKMQNPNTASILRQSSVAYIGSFVSRAMFVPISVVATTLEVMCHWIHRYINSQAECARSYVDITLHGPFYSVCQTAFYVFAFRHQELVEMDKGFEFLRRLGFERIVTCRLNPLKVCLPVVVRNFAAVVRNYQLAYCYTIIEKNQRAILPVVPYRGNGSRDIQVTALNPLDSFFPFDPYLLTRSSEFIAPLYREYRAIVEDESPHVEVEEDDFLADEEPGNDVAANSASSSLTEFLTCSLSPGFKHSFPT